MAASSPLFVPRRELFIDGGVEGAVVAQPYSHHKPPATEESIGDIPAATAEDVNLAVDAARNAFFRNRGRDWPRTSGAYRAKFLRAIAAKIKEKKEQLAKLETLDCGKPLEEAAWDMDDVAGCFEYYADLAEALDKKQKASISLPMETFKCHILKEPIGVVGLVTPWNYPLLMAVWKVAPALAAGCTAVLKPSELSSVTCLELAAVCKEVRLPAGVLNIVTGFGHEAGAALVSNQSLDKISFTGSTETGQKIMTAAAQVVKPVSLELGGKSPIIVFEDVDIEKAVEWTLFGCFWTNGQICSATSRLLVHARGAAGTLDPGSLTLSVVQFFEEPSHSSLFCASKNSISEVFVKRLVEWSNNIKLSDPLEEGCRLGPVVSKTQYEKIMKFITTARNDGATILCGGARPEHIDRGFFIAPTVITGVKPSMQIWREEVFGPVLCVQTFETEDEAIDLANNTDYGLAGAVLSKDPEKCSRVAEEVRAGIMWVNCSQPTFCQAPWGGTKRSGFGRELGEWGLENYLNVKQVTQYISDEPWGWYSSPSRL